MDSFSEDSQARARYIEELRPTCERIARDIGINSRKLPDGEPFTAAIGTAINFFEEVFERTYTGEEWEKLAVRRELFRVIGFMHKEKISHAYEGEYRRDEERTSLHIVNEFQTSHPETSPHNDEQHRLDPACWGLSRTNKDHDAISPYLHLSQLVELIRLQNEKAVKQARAGRDPLPDGKLRPEEYETLATMLKQAINPPSKGNEGRRR